MKSYGASRELLLNAIISKLNDMSLEQITALHNELQAEQTAFVVNSSLLLFDTQDIKQWAKDGINIHTADDTPDNPIYYSVDGENSDISFVNELAAVRHAFEASIVNVGDFESPTAAELPFSDYITFVSAYDPFAQHSVDLIIYKDRESGNLFGVDSGFVATLSEGDPVVNPVSGLWTLAVGD